MGCIKGFDTMGLTKFLRPNISESLSLWILTLTIRLSGSGMNMFNLNLTKDKRNRLWQDIHLCLRTVHN